VATGDDGERIGLSRSTPDGQTVALAGALSGQRGWRRSMARVIAFGALTVIAVGVIASVVVALS
jgi:hypothetical protein